MRYNKIIEKNPREIVLLKSFPCGYGRCKFCNYIEDNSMDEKEMNEINIEVLGEVAGSFGVLEVINSGSVFELPKRTLVEIKKIVDSKKIKILYFESYYGYINRLEEIRSFFQGTEIRFRIGIETFDNKYRIENYGKNFEITEKTLEKLSEKFYSACLLVCTVGQSKKMIERDIEIGLKYFKQITINVFIDNGTTVKQDTKLVSWLMKKFGHLKEHPQVELLYDNKDLGVFEQ